METPTARVLREGQFRFGAGQADPYRYYYGTVSPLKGLEIGGRITEILDVPALTAGYGNYKDKAIDLKWQFIPEGKWWPAVAMGIMDPQGTRLFSSQYIVASKQIYPFDLTLGFGNGRYGKQPLSASGESLKMEMLTDNASWRSSGQFFGGIQYAVTDWLTLIAEYSPIRYEQLTTDPAQARYFPTAVPSKFNFGMRLKPWDWLEADVSYQRGNQLGINLSVAFELGKPLVPIYYPPYQEKPEFQLDPLTGRIARALHDSGFSGIGIKRDGDQLWIEAANDTYFFTMKAVGMALQVVNQILSKKVGSDRGPAGEEKKEERPDPPEERIRTIHLILTDNGTPLVEFVTQVEDLGAFYAEELKLSEFLQLSKTRTDVWKTPEVPKSYWRNFDYVLKPDFKVFLNDPSGFVKYRIGALANGLYTPWRGGSFVAGVLGYPLNTVSSSNTPSATPVRTDIVDYQEQKVELALLLFNQIEKFDHEIYGRVAAGYLEEQYAGLDWEVAKPVLGGRFTLGVSGSVVKKREPHTAFSLKQNDWKDPYVTGFFNVRLNLPEVEMNIDLKNGQFLAGDRGTVVTVSKNFNGVVLSAWYSVTGTSVFKDDFNIGYHDKGIAISIPLRMFTGRDSRTAYSTGITPWTRDVAQDIVHYNGLFDFIGRNNGVYVEKDKPMINK